MEADRCSRRIRAFRKLKGYTQKQLASNLNVSVSLIGEIERGIRMPTKSMLMQIANALQVELEELYGTNQL